MSVIEKRILADGMVDTDRLIRGDALEAGGFRHRRINRGEPFAGLRNRINGIEGFWSQT